MTRVSDRLDNVKVLVTDGEQRASLAVVRSLGRLGCAVIVCSRNGQSLAGASRHCRLEIQSPDPLEDAAGFAVFVSGLAKAHGVDIVLPITEGSLLAVAGNPPEPPAVLPFPPLASIEAICDKARVLEAGRSLGISIPAQTVFASRQEAWAGAPRLYPVVLKPSRSVSLGGGKRMKLGVEYARDEAGFRRLIEKLPDEAYPILVQQRIQGPGTGVFLLLWDGKPMARFAHRRLREKPPSGGVSVYRESIEAAPELFEKSLQLLSQFYSRGLAMVEYKVEAATGTPYLMEINGRFWGSVQLAVDSGVDFPAILVKLALGLAQEPVLTYRTGLRSRWWLGDLDHLLARLRRSRAALGLNHEDPGRLQVIAQFLRLWWPGDRSEVLRFSDIRPFFREVRAWLRRT